MPTPHAGIPALSIPTRISLLAALCLASLGCGSVIIPASPSTPTSAEDLSGNWIIVPAVSPDSPLFLTGTIIQSPGRLLAARLHFSSYSCPGLGGESFVGLTGSVQSTGTFQFDLPAPRTGQFVLTAGSSTISTDELPGRLQLDAPGCLLPPTPILLIRVPSFSGTFIGTLLSSAGVPSPTRLQIQQSSTPDSNGYLPFAATVNANSTACTATISFTGFLSGTSLMGASALTAQGSTGITAEADHGVNHLAFDKGNLVLASPSCALDTFTGQLDRD